jgi:hypothetical protein
VRRPIYRDSKEEWLAYESHLEPLKAVLGEAVAAYPAAPATAMQR